MTGDFLPVAGNFWICNEEIRARPVLRALGLTAIRLWIDRARRVPEVVVVVAGPGSVRAQKTALRERIRVAGLGHDRVAGELARRYGLRPRVAWREAHGWGLAEAAAQLNEHAARSGVDQTGTASMTVSHLSEYERWPGGAALDGKGPMSGRKPGPYLLALMARVYGCGVPDLVDVADREHLPAADLMYIDECEQGGIRRAADRPGSPGLGRADVPRGPGRVPVPGLGLAGSVPDRAAAPGAAHLPALPGVNYLGTWELPQARRSPVEREVVMTAHEGSEHAEKAEQRDIGDMTLEQIRADIVRLSREYMTGEPFPLLQEMRQVRGRVHTALERRVWPKDQAELYFDLACLNCLLAITSNALGYPQAAEELVRAAWAYATIIDHRPLKARLRSEAADIAYWHGRPRHALGMASSALSFQSAGPNAVMIHLQVASTAARLGDADLARQAISDAAAARERNHNDDLVEMGGEFSFSHASQHYYAGRALLELPSPGREGLAELERATTAYAAGPQPDEDHSTMCRMLAHADLATAQLRAGDLDAAAAALDPVLALRPASRTDLITRRLQAGVRPELAARKYQGSARATELDERIEDFEQETIVAELHDLPGWGG